MRLAEHLSPSRILALRGRTKDDVLRELVAVAAEEPGVRDHDGLLRAIFARERILSTGIGLGIAVPHAKLESVDEFVVAVGISGEGVDFGAIDENPAHVIVLIAAPEGRQRDYLGLLAQVTVTLKDAETRGRIIAAVGDPAEVHRLLT
jgi:mannitol/fructose-specific phosphotransferase system IIA component (Ntr-type)